MANEISLISTFSVTKSGVPPVNRTLTNTITMSGTHTSAGVQDVSTTYEALATSADVATNGLLLVKNVDATNYVELGREVSSAFYGVVRINAGESYVFRLSQGVTIFGRANTATVKLEFYAIEA